MELDNALIAVHEFIRKTMRESDNPVYVKDIKLVIYMNYDYFYQCKSEAYKLNAFGSSYCDFMDNDTIKGYKVFIVQGDDHPNISIYRVKDKS